MVPTNRHPISSDSAIESEDYKDHCCNFILLFSVFFISISVNAITGFPVVTEEWRSNLDKHQIIQVAWYGLLKLSGKLAYVIERLYAM
mgnify:CR=1 FL=1